MEIPSPARIYLFKVSNGNTRTVCEICSNLTIRTAERLRWRRCSVFVGNFDIFHILFWCFHCWLWTSKCWLIYIWQGSSFILLFLKMLVQGSKSKFFGVRSSFSVFSLQYLEKRRLPMTRYVMFLLFSNILYTSYISILY